MHSSRILRASSSVRVVSRPSTAFRSIGCERCRPKPVAMVLLWYVVPRRSTYPRNGSLVFLSKPPMTSAFHRGSIFERRSYMVCARYAYTCAGLSECPSSSFDSSSLVSSNAHQPVKHVLDMLPIAHITAGANDYIVAHRCKTADIHVARERAIRTKRVRSKHHAILVPKAEHRRAGYQRLSVSRSTYCVCWRAASNASTARPAELLSEARPFDDTTSVAGRELHVCPGYAYMAWWCSDTLALTTLSRDKSSYRPKRPPTLDSRRGSTLLLRMDPVVVRPVCPRRRASRRSRN